MKGERQLQKQERDEFREIILEVAAMAEDRNWSHAAGWQALGTLAAALFASESAEHMTPADELRREFLRYISSQMENIQSKRITLQH